MLVALEVLVEPSTAPSAIRLGKPVSADNTSHSQGSKQWFFELLDSTEADSKRKLGGNKRWQPLRLL